MLDSQEICCQGVALSDLSEFDMDNVEDFCKNDWLAATSDA